MPPVIILLKVTVDPVHNEVVPVIAPVTPVPDNVTVGALLIPAPVKVIVPGIEPAAVGEKRTYTVDAAIVLDAETVYTAVVPHVVPLADTWYPVEAVAATVPVVAGNKELPVIEKLCDAELLHTFVLVKLSALAEGYKTPVRALAAKTPRLPAPPAVVVTVMLFTLLLRFVSDSVSSKKAAPG